jgi:hypothetical protein
MLECPKSRTLTMPSSDEDVKQWEISFIDDGDAE